MATLVELRLVSGIARLVLDSGLGVKDRQCFRESLFLTIYGTLKLQNKEPSYKKKVVGTLAIDVWADTFGTAWRGLGGLRPSPVPSTLYQMYQPTHQRPVCQLHIFRCGTIIASEF